MLIDLSVIFIELIIELLNSINIYVCIGSAEGRGAFLRGRKSPTKEEGSSADGRRLLYRRRKEAPPPTEEGSEAEGLRLRGRGKQAPPREKMLHRRRVKVEHLGGGLPNAPAS